MVNRGTMDLVDPPDMLARMAKEILHEGIRQQYDVAAGMANRLDKTRADELWLEVRAWEKTRPDNWWGRRARTVAMGRRRHAMRLGRS